MFTIVFDINGNFQCVLIHNADGSATQIQPGTPGWDAYVAANGMPPPTGVPTFPLPPPTTQQLADAQTIANFKNNVAPTAIQQLQALQALIRLKA